MHSVDSSFVSGVLHGRSIRSFVLGRVHAGLACVVALALMLFAGAVPAGTASIVRASAQQRNDAIQHTDPLNFDPVVRDAYEHFYVLDFDGALSRSGAVLKAHPQEPMAYGYELMFTVFRELYHQDLLDTTYYAHDSFLTSTPATGLPTTASRRMRATRMRTLRADTSAECTRRSSRWWTTAMWLRRDRDMLRGATRNRR
jgi:hypothetical protein